MSVRSRLEKALQLQADFERSVSDAEVLFEFAVPRRARLPADTEAERRWQIRKWANVLLTLGCRTE